MKDKTGFILRNFSSLLLFLALILIAPLNQISNSQLNSPTDANNPYWPWKCWDNSGGTKYNLCGDQLRDLALLSPSDGWAVGAHGVIAHFD